MRDWLWENWFFILGAISLVLILCLIFSGCGGGEGTGKYQSSIIIVECEGDNKECEEMMR